MKKTPDFRNENAKKIKPYVPGEQPQGGDYIKLNTNENPMPPSPAVVEELKKIIKNPELLKKYPSPKGESLRTEIANKWKLKPENVLITNGSDEALSLICRTFLDHGNFAVYPEVTYTLYETLIQMTGANSSIIPMKKNQPTPFCVDLEALDRAYGKIVFLPNPNAPTGEFIQLEELESVVMKSDKLWIIDEAYNDFVEKSASFLNCIKKYENVIVTRTFSKSHSLAGLRAGYAVSCNEEIMNALYAMKDSYNEDIISLRLASAAFTDEGYLKKCVAYIAEERELLTKELEKLGFFTLPSKANFILTKPPEKIKAEELYEDLKEKKILTRYFNTSYISDYLRISIGSKEENNILLEKIKEIINR
ncbi:MAG: histidinol-phosphate transaminase [Spirochaetia bacterium]|nr:histidinol-phosphate transaminase [Spirochaetia bacterium]